MRTRTTTNSSHLEPLLLVKYLGQGAGSLSSSSWVLVCSGDFSASLASLYVGSNHCALSHEDRLQMIHNFVKLASLPCRLLKLTLVTVKIK